MDGVNNPLNEKTEKSMEVENIVIHLIHTTSSHLRVEGLIN